MRSSIFTAALAALTLGVAGCDLDVENPNAPDVSRALSDPGGLEALLSGAMQTWATTRGDYFSALPMTAMADNYSGSWNNAAIRYYTSVGVECAARCGWTNSATADETAGGPSVEAGWYGYFTVISSANDVLRAIDDGVCFDGNFTPDDCADDNSLTERAATIAHMLRGMGLAGLALMYDQAFIVNQNSSLDSLLTAAFSPRDQVRDAALAAFDSAFTHAGTAGTSWVTEPGWMGVGNATTYNQTRIQQLIRTMQAELIAMYPRDVGEAANGTGAGQTDWARVATLASAGISSGTPFDFTYHIDAANVCGIDCVKTWGNSILTFRVDNRVAAKITNHTNPWPQPAGNPCPTGAGVYGQDRRVGDGSFGPSNNYNGAATTAATANAGTDYACSGVAIFPAARGQYHQSNLQHIRYHALAYEGEGLPGENGEGDDPYYTRQMNDLLWAEGILRSTGNNATAAARINNSRNGRGNLPALTGAEALGTVGAAAPVVGTALHALYYEQDIEFMGQGATPFFNQRRRAPFCAVVNQTCPTGTEGLLVGTPLHMPVPDKELQVLLRANYTFGGPSGPAKLVSGGRLARPTVKDRWDDIQRMKRIAMYEMRK
jgi:hypothetical protein